MAGYDQMPSLEDIGKTFWQIAKDEVEDTRFRLEALEKLWEMIRWEKKHEELSSLRRQASEDVSGSQTRGDSI